MNVNWKLVSGILAAVLTYDEVAGFINHKRFAHNLEQIELLKKQRDAFDEMNQYLANKLDEHEVPYTAFDDLAIKTMADIEN